MASRVDYDAEKLQALMDENPAITPVEVAEVLGTTPATAKRIMMTQIVGKTQYAGILKPATRAGRKIADANLTVNVKGGLLVSPGKLAFIGAALEPGVQVTLKKTKTGFEVVVN